MLIRYKGPIVALRGAIGRLLVDGRMRLAGRVQEVRPAEVERPRYWVQADGAWCGPYQSWERAREALADVLALWGELATAAMVRTLEPAPDGWCGYAAGCRLRLLPGGDRAPISV